MFSVKGNPQLNKEYFTFSKKSSYPYFTRTVINNGIYGYVDYYDDKHLVKGNSIAVGMMGMQFFYMSHDFYAGQFTKNVIPKFKGFNWRVALWFISWFNKSSKWYLGLLVRDFDKAFIESTISVPRNSDGSLALKFIESRIREMEKSRICEMEESRNREMKAYLKVSGFNNCELTEEEKKALQSMSAQKFRNFKIENLFDINTGRDIIIGRVQNGNIPLISHQHDNNGISKRIKLLKERMLFEYDKTIALADRGVFYATTQMENFHIGTRVKALTFKSGTMKEATRLFVVTAINKLQILFTDYLVNATNKLPTLEIKLPVTSSGSIDYHFMETYIRAIEKLTIQRVKDWRDKEIETTKNILENDTKGISLQLQNKPKQYDIYGDNIPKIVAEDIFIYGSIPIDLPNTKRNELITKKLDLILMYAIGSGARHKTESAGKIALGIKESMLNNEQIAAYNSIKYLMFHYWSNPMVYQLTKEPVLVEKDAVPKDYMIRLEKDAVKFMLLEYNTLYSADLGDVNILKTQRRGEIRYLPFVTTLESIKNE